MGYLQIRVFEYSLVLFPENALHFGQKSGFTMPRRVVVKLGTSVLTNGGVRLFRPNLVEIARQCAALQREHEIIICSSGAGAAGREQLGFPQLAPTLSNKQMLAAVGQSRLMQLWTQFFAIYGRNVGQILLTRADVESRQRYLNARDTLLCMLENGIIPIINENDAVANDEIKVGDNDNLGALVAVLAEADLLLLLTDQEGLYTADPRKNAEAELIREVGKIDDQLRLLAGGSGTTVGTGGMVTKLESAEIATRAGIDVIIAKGTLPNIIERLVVGDAIGTRFTAQQSPLVSRKRWIFAGSKPSGTLVIDQGAERALLKQGKSLLPAGIVAVAGNFMRGATILITNQRGDRVARGIARYRSADLKQIMGGNSAEISQKLGYTHGSAAVHRNDMILL